MLQTQSTPFTIRAKRLTALGTKGLRVTPEYLAQQEANRKAIFACEFCEEENVVPEGGTVLNVTGSQQNEKPCKGKSTPRPIWKLNFTEPQQPGQPEKLYQNEEDIDDECLYTKYTGCRRYSFTDSRQSRQNCAWKELMILLRKDRIPTMEVRLNFFVQFATKWDIDELREKIRRCLHYRKIDALVAIELTNGEDGKPNNMVHFHYLVGNKKNEENLSSKEEKQRRKTIARFIQKVCEHQSFVLKKDFKIESRPLWDGEKYFAYFVKYGKHGKDIPLFIEGLNMQELTQTGWFEKGEKKRLWDEFLKKKYGDKYVEEMKKKYGTNNTAWAKNPTKKSLSKKK